LFLNEIPLRLTKHPTPRQCHQYSFARFERETRELPLELVPVASPDLACHPTLRHRAVQAYCQELKKEGGFRGVASFFRLRTISSPEFERVFESENLCGEALKIGAREARQ